MNSSTLPVLAPTRISQLRVGRVKKNIFSIEGLNSSLFKVALSDQPVYLGPLGLSGDSQAFPTHGGLEKALMHYAAKHYQAWKEELPESENLLNYGGFGENLITDPADGYNEHTVCIGDVFSLGKNDVRIQVTQPRQPCYKLNHRFEVRDMARRAQDANRTGWHHRILNPGYISVNDVMKLVERPHPDWPLSKVQHYMYTETTNVDRMRELIYITELGEETRGIFRKRVEKNIYRNEADRLVGPEAAALRWNRYRLVTKTKETELISSFTFEAIDKSASPLEAMPGSHVRVKLGPKTGNLVRAYSVVEGNSNCFTLGISKKKDSRGGSRFFHDNLVLGEELVFSKMTSNFSTMNPFVYDDHILIAGGIGITALLAIARHLQKQGFDFTLHYAIKRELDVAFAYILQEFGGNVQYYVSKGGRKLSLTAILKTATSRSHVYVCGPARLLSSVKEVSAELGFPEDNIHSEAFSVSASGEPFTVQIESRCQELEVMEEESLLDVLRNAGFDLPSSCEVGNCGTCRIGVKNGQVEHRGTGLLDEEKKTTMLACVSRGVGTISLDL